MKTYRDIAVEDLENALFSEEHNKYRMAVFNFQQFAEKSAKHLLMSKSPNSKLLKDHRVELILEAYDKVHQTSDEGDMARYLTSFYFNTRYPGDNYTEISKEQMEKAKRCALALDKYFKEEILLIEQEYKDISEELSKSSVFENKKRVDNNEQ